MTLGHRFVKLARKKEHISNSRGDHRRLRRDLSPAFYLRVSLIVTAHGRQTVSIPAMGGLMARLQLNSFAQLAFRLDPIAIVVQPDKTQRCVRLSQFGISVHRAQGRFLCTLPGFRWRWLYEPIEQSITVGKLCMSNSKLR